MLYTSLPPSQPHIRVLILSPGTPDTPLTCSTTAIPLCSPPHSFYEALSYVWGSPLDPEHITFNGQEGFPVTKNLFIALKYLRSTERERVLWVDALCINQQDVAERNEQVRLMGDVYKNASEVLIWLGEHEGEQEEKKHAENAWGMLGRVEKISSEAKIEEVVTVTKEEEMVLFAFFFELMEKTWFKRLWTVQELVLATADPWVGLEWKWVRWSMLWKVWDYVWTRRTEEMPGMSMQGADGALLRPTNIKLGLLNNLRERVTATGGEDLKDILNETHTSQVTEPRDRIFALCGMLSPQDRRDITIDYQRSIAQVYAEAVAHLFKMGEGPRFLCGVLLAGPDCELEFPSWVPMFGSTPFMCGITYFPPGIGVSGVGSAATNGSVDKDLKTLRVRAMRIDIVKDEIKFGVTRNDYMGKLDEVEALVDKARELAEQFKEQRPYLYDFKSKEPLWRVLITNKKYSGATMVEAPQSYEEMYETLRQRQKYGYSEEQIEGGWNDPVREYYQSLPNRLPSSSFFITETGFFGIGSKALEKGDLLAIWFGAPAPFIMRPRLNSEEGDGEVIYSVVGVAYVAGIMKGEMVDEIFCEDLEDDEVFIIR